MAGKPDFTLFYKKFMDQTSLSAAKKDASPPPLDEVKACATRLAFLFHDTFFLTGNMKAVYAKSEDLHDFVKNNIESLHRLAGKLTFPSSSDLSELKINDFVQIMAEQFSKDVGYFHAFVKFISSELESIRTNYSLEEYDVNEPENTMVSSETTILKYLKKNVAEISRKRKASAALEKKSSAKVPRFEISVSSEETSERNTPGEDHEDEEDDDDDEEDEDDEEDDEEGEEDEEDDTEESNSDD
jgi:Ran GTPase-activating protein (RanGAP) involved in mRNA processing and transport